MTGTNHLYCPCTTFRSMINHPHLSCNSDFYSTSTSPTGYSIARAAHDRTISSSTRPVFYRSRVPFTLFVRSLLVVTHGRGTSIRLGYLLSHRCLRILHSLMRRGLWLWMTVSPPLISFRKVLLACLFPFIHSSILLISLHT